MKTFKELRKFPYIDYTVDVNWTDLEFWLDRQCSQKGGLSPLELNPDFQRGHVWTQEQQTLYIEFILSGGSSGTNLYFNHPGWRSSYKGDFVLVDGLQRITAVLAFLHNKITAYGSYYKDFIDRLPSEASFKINVAKLKTKKDVLEWYLMMNTGGTPHSNEEIERIKKMRDSTDIDCTT
jgi:hypothetical protein